MFDEVPDIGENAFTDGFLSRKFTNNVIDHCNLWHHLAVKLPSSKYVSAKFIIAEDKAVLDLTKVKFNADAATYPLQLISANTATQAKVRVVLGYVAGFKADSGMTTGSDSPVFLKTLASAATHYIYADVTVAYSATVGVWQATACSVSTATSLPASTSTHAYVLIGSAVVATTSGGLGVTSVTNAIGGSQLFQRIGNATTYVDYNQLQ